MTNNKISDTHYLMIDCQPGHLRPKDVLRMILSDQQPVNTDVDVEEEDALKYDDILVEYDFTVIYIRFGECKFGVHQDKEQLFEDCLPKIIEQLSGLYNCGIIRYAEWKPE
jgi:hypothetical protein